jgi:hypothetical protein
MTTATILTTTVFYWSNASGSVEGILWQNHDKMHAIKTRVFSYSRVPNCSNIPSTGPGLRAKQPYGISDCLTHRCSSLNCHSVKTKFVSLPECYEVIWVLWGYLCVVRLSGCCEVIYVLWGYLDVVRLSGNCEVIWVLWGYLNVVMLPGSCVVIWVLRCHLGVVRLPELWGYLSFVKLYGCCEVTWVLWGYLSVNHIFWDVTVFRCMYSSQTFDR